MHAAITGASSGIGEALAVDLHRAGYKLTLVARRTELLKAIADKLGDDVRCLRADLDDVERADAWVGEAEARNGPIELLINNAGVQYVEPALEVSTARGESLMRINYSAPVRIIRRVAPAMVARGAGAIVNVSSMAAITFTPAMADYCASKAAIAGFSEVLREELAPSGVHVLTVYPGPVRTAMEQAARDKYTGNLANAIPTGEATELARLIREAVADREPRLIYPGVYATAYWFRNTAQWLTTKLTPPLKR